MKADTLSPQGLTPSRRIAVYTLIIICVAGVSSVLDRFLLSILVQPIKSDLGLSDVQMGLLNGIAFALFYATLGIPIAYFADRSNRRRLIAMGLILWSAATAAGGFANGFAWLFAARMMVGIGEAALNPATYSILADLFEKRHLARAIGVFQSSLQMATGISIVIGGGLFAYFTNLAGAGGHVLGFVPWRITMITIAIPGLVLAFIILLTVREPARRNVMPQVANPIGEIFTALKANGGLLMIVIIAYCPIAISGYGMLSWYPTFLVRDFGFTLPHAAYAFGAATAVAGLFGSFSGGVIADSLYPKFRNRAPLVVLTWATCGALITTLAPLMPSAILSLAIYGIGQFIYSMSTPLVATLIQLNAPAHVRARVSGVWVCLFNLTGFGLGPLIVALLTQHLFKRPEAVNLAISLNAVVMLGLAIVLLFVALKRSWTVHELKDRAA